MFKCLLKVTLTKIKRETLDRKNGIHKSLYPEHAKKCYSSVKRQPGKIGTLFKQTLHRRRRVAGKYALGRSATPAVPGERQVSTTAPGRMADAKGTVSQSGTEGRAARTAAQM